MYGSSSTLTGYTLLGRKDYNNYTTLEYETADAKIQKRLIKLNDKWYYPVKSGTSGTFVEYSEQLIKQAIFGKHVQDKLIASTNGLSDLINHLNHIVTTTGGITTLGNRFIPVDSSHKSLNYFCQGQGAEAMKHYILTVHKALDSKGLVHGVDFIQQASIYDELDFIVKDQYVDILADTLAESYAVVSRKLNMQCTYQGEVLVGGRNGHANSWAGCH